MMLVLALMLLLHRSLVVQAKADGPSTAAESSLQILIPPWTVERSADLLLSFTTADAAAREQETAPIMFRGKLLDSVSLRKGYFYGNLAIIRFGSQYITAVRKIQFYITPRTAVAEYPLDPDPKKKWISWWTNRISLCTADAATLQPKACTNFDPRNWTDCMWNGGFETLGPEDPRLIVWPSKGLFMMFNSKPWPVNPSGTKPEDTQCAGPWAQQPFLIPLASYTGAGSPGLPGSLAVSQLGQQQQQQQTSSSSTQQQQQQQKDLWTQGLIRLQYLPPELQGDTQAKLEKLQTAHKGSGPFLHKQKNWNPFIYRDELYFSQSFMPHIVIKPQPDGTCNMVHMTDGLPFKALPAKPRGNTQAVLLPAAVTGLSKDVYLGIVHTEVDRAYENFFYQMQAEPPFSISAVSAAIPLIPGSHPRVPAWDHISFPMSLQYLEDSNQLMIGYGSGDQVPRVKFMPLSEVLALFSISSSQEGTAAAGTSGAAAAAADGTSGGMNAKVDGKLDANGLSPRAQAAGKAAVAAVEEAMGLRARHG